MIDPADGLSTKGRIITGMSNGWLPAAAVYSMRNVPSLTRERGYTLMIFQIWGNLPHSHKRVEPICTMIWNEEVPVVTREENGAKASVRIIYRNV